MELRLYDTLTAEDRTFSPIDPANVRMYVCGPTVYDFAHIGNARPVIVFDVLFRLLRYLYGERHVTYVRNITDVDDKINARAAQEYPALPLNKAILHVTKKTEAQFQADVGALGCLEPNKQPRATRHIPQMKELIERLIQSRHAYVAEDHVLFYVPSMTSYGSLSKRSLDEMLEGARVEVAPFKKDPMDFVLWKPSKLGEPSWTSPAGIRRRGRPGWHIECSAMADFWLWTKSKPRLSPDAISRPHQFDIHGGGVDLCFPHHENEIAQSRCAFSIPVMANYWVHNGFLQVEGEKMSKSLGNFVTINELLSGWNSVRWERAEIRLAMLSTAYRQPLDWTLHRLTESRRTIDQWQRLTANIEYARANITPSAELLDSLCDDLNTPKAITQLHSVANKAANNSALAFQLYSDLVFLGIFADRREEDFRLKDIDLVRAVKKLKSKARRKRALSKSKKKMPSKGRARRQRKGRKHGRL